MSIFHKLFKKKTSWNIRKGTLAIEEFLERLDAYAKKNDLKIDSSTRKKLLDLYLDYKDDEILGILESLK